MTVLLPYSHQVEESGFNPNRVLDDALLQGGTPLDVQTFLDVLDSPLATLEVTDESDLPVKVAELLQEVARETPIDVRVLLTRLQVEQSLLTTEPTPEKLDWAMGFGVTDDIRWPGYRGFAVQVRMAARELVGYLDSRHPFSVVDQVGLPMNVADGLVVPENLATAALYRYTPWIGNRPLGNRQPPFGNLLFYRVFTELFGYPPDRQSPDRLEGWRLIAPPDNWRSPLELTPEALESTRELARRLNLVLREDRSRKKLYLGAPVPRGEAGDPPKDRLVYPSGVSFAVVPEAALGAQASRYAPADPETAAPLVAVDPKARLSEHFTMGEFLPHDPSYRYTRVAPELVALLETLRLELGGFPLLVNSGYRPPDYNRQVGGVPRSTHRDGLAADVSSFHVTLAQLHEVADRLVKNRGGVGFYPSQLFVHVDLRGEHARWTS